MSTSCLVGAVGIGLKATLKIRKLFIPLDGKNAKNTGFAQPRYTPGTQVVFDLTSGGASLLGGA
jgi:hypothetical protein